MHEAKTCTATVYIIYIRTVSKLLASLMVKCDARGCMGVPLPDMATPSKDSDGISHKYFYSIEILTRMRLASWDVGSQVKGFCCCHQVALSSLLS